MDNNEIKTQEEPTGAVQNNLASNKERENLKMFLWGIGGVLALAVVLSASIGIYRVYAKTATDKFTMAVATTLRLPALKINGERILYTSYVEDLRAIQNLRTYDKANSGQYATITDEQMNDQVLWRLANNTLVEKAAKTFGVTVSSTDLDSLKSQILQQFKDTATAETELKQRYGWDMETYTKKVMRPYVLQSKIDSQIQSDITLKDEVEKQAEKVLLEIKNGASFASSAVKYGQDGTATNGGDLGWFKKGDMVSEFETAVFALKKGELNKTLVETDYGYHIIKLVDMRTSTAKDSAGKETKVSEIRASHILFRIPDISWYLDKQAKSSNIHLYLKVHNPFTDYLKSVN
jgi:hypothetical protein